MDMFDEIRALLPTGEVSDATVFNIVRVAGADEPELERLRVGQTLAEEILGTVKRMVAQAESFVDASEAMDAVVGYEPGKPLGPGQLAHAPGLARDLHRKAAALRSWLQADPFGRPQLPPGEDVRAIGLSVVGSGRVTVVRRRDSMQGFRSRHDNNRLLAVFSNGRLESTQYVFAYDGKWDAILYGDDAILRDPAAFEAILGVKPPVDKELAEVVESLKEVMPAEALDRLTSHLPSRDRLRDVDPDVVSRLRSDGARDIVLALDFDEVSLENGVLTFGTSNTARAQAVRLLTDGFLSSALTTKSYAAASKEPWPPRRIVTSVRLSDGRVTHLLGHGDWSPQAVDDARRDIKQHVARYSVHIGDGLRPVRVSRAAASRGELWVDSRGPDEDKVRASANLLPLMPTEGS